MTKKQDYEYCKAAPILEWLGNKRALVVLVKISENKPVRFNVLYRNIPSVSEKVLSHVLRRLTTDCVISRELFPDVPQTPRVGGVIMIKVENRMAVDSIITRDSFNINGIADCQIVEFAPTMFCENNFLDTIKMSNVIRGIFPGFKARRPQYVLGTKNGDERTSNVTEEDIRDAIDDIEDNGCVYLEKCVPVVLVSYAEAFSIDYFKDSSIAVCFRVNGYLFRMWRSDVDCDLAADIMCAFFRNASLPDMTGWQCQKIHPEQEEKKEERLCVDGEDFRYFGSPDVVGALENIIEGKSHWMLYDFTGGSGGYVNVHRYDNGAAPTAGYKVEYVRWTEPTPVGYRGIVSDAGLLRCWLWSLIDGDRLPDPMDGCRKFDVNNHFERLVFRFLE